MKKLGPLLLLVGVLVGGYFLYTSVLGGSVSGTGPTKGLPTVKPEVPDVGDAANKGAKGAEGGANWLADTIASLSPAAWRVIGILLVVSGIVWVIKDPKRRSIAFGLAVIGLLVVIIGR